MAHVCDAAVVLCEDFRLHQRTHERNVLAAFVQELGCDCDVITRGGAIQDLVRPQPGFDQSLLRDLAVSVNLHKVKTIYLVNHENCGAYAHFNFTSRKLEIMQHYKDLQRAKEIVAQHFHGVKVEIRFAELDAGSGDKYKFKAVG
jgi:hypothetical protein